MGDPHFTPDLATDAGPSGIDADAFDQVVRAIYPALAASVFRTVRDAAASEDVIQDALLAAWRRRDTLAVDGLPAYLFQATRNRALNHLRDTRTCAPERGQRVG